MITSIIIIIIIIIIINIIIIIISTVVFCSLHVVQLKQCDWVKSEAYKLKSGQSNRRLHLLLIKLIIVDNISNSPTKLTERFDGKITKITANHTHY